MKAPYEKVQIEPFNYAVSLIGGKWKMQILFWLWKDEIMRYSEIKKALGNVTHKMLSNKLKELEADALIIRHEYPGVPLCFSLIFENGQFRTGTAHMF